MSKHLVEKRINSPQGTWDYSGIIGAKVQIKSIPITNLDDFRICGILFNILLIISNKSIYLEGFNSSRYKG